MLIVFSLPYFLSLIKMLPSILQNAGESHATSAWDETIWLYDFINLLHFLYVVRSERLEKNTLLSLKQSCVYGTV